MRRGIGWVVVVSLAAALAGCGGEIGGGVADEPTFETTATVAPQDSPIDGSAAATAAVTDRSTTSDVSPSTDAAPTEAGAASLDQADVDGLLWMREEEKLARDVYQALSEMWDLPIFSNIADSEQTHTDAVGELLERFDIADPMADDVPGVFVDPDIQALYDDFVQQGSRSPADALTVGATIEDLDIVDLRLRESGIAAIDEVYANLEKGSRNHLRAFVTNLERRGAEYSPSHLTLEEYEEIVGSPRERGSAGG